jgi:hypothetical protein
MAINNINIGAVENDGTGDPIRTAFDTVNDNFAFVQAGLFAGTESSIISALSVTGGYLYSNSYVRAVTYVNANSIVGNTITSNGNLTVTQDGALIIGNVSILGNLTVSGTQQSTAASNSTAPILLIHANAAPYTVNDNKDIGLQWQYYKTSDKYGFLGWQNTTESLVYLDNITESSNIITSGTPGNVQFGQLLLSNTTAATSNVTGALQVRGGAGVQGNLFVQSNVFVGNAANVGNLTVRGNVIGSMYFSGSDTIFIGGSPVQTAAQSFNGGTIALPTLFADTTSAVSALSGAVQIRGGLGVAGNVWVGNLQSNIGGNVRANIQGNIFTPAQPFITSLGTLTSLNVNGQANVNDVSPNSNLVYSLGTADSDRFVKLWVFDIDMSGTLSGGAVNSTGGTHTGNLFINTATAAALRSTTAVAEVFETGPTTIRIGGGGVTQFRNNTQATSSTTGAVQVTGGMSISTGSLYIGGSGGNSLVAVGTVRATNNNGNSIVATGNVAVSGNILPFDANATYNLGSTTNWWNTFYGVSTQAQYADLAENYVADQNYSPGTVVVFGGSVEITTTDTFADTRVAGVISHNPGYLMNAANPGLPVALRGRVPVKLIGTVSKGDLLVTSAQAGYAQSIGQNDSYGHAVFAKSLVTDGRNGSKIIEAVII